MFGYSHDEIIGMHGSHFIAPEYRILVKEKMMQDVADPYEVQAIGKNGTTFGVEIQAKNISYRGELVRVTAVRDISDRKQAEKALRESEERYKFVFDHMGSGLAVYEAVDDGDDFIFKDINPAGARIGSRSREEHLGKSVLEITIDSLEVAPDMSPAHGNVSPGIYLRIFRAHKYPMHIEGIFHNVNRDGSWCHSD